MKELQEQLAVNTRGQDYSRAASSVHTFQASAAEGQAVRREYIQRELDALQKERAACLEEVEQCRAVVRRCCFYYMCDLLEARYFKSLQWREIGAAVGLPVNKAKAIEVQALLHMALCLHHWRPGYMAQEELDGVSVEECQARYQDAVEHWAAVERVAVERGRTLGHSLDRARAAVDCLASRLGLPAEQVRKDFERAYAGGGSCSRK